MYWKTEPGTETSRFIVDDHFSLFVELGKPQDYLHHMVFYHGNTNLFEIATDPHSKRVKQIVLTTCARWSLERSCLGSHDYNRGILYFEAPRENDCEQFDLAIFSDAARLCLSKSEASVFVRSGNVVFGLAEDKLVEIRILELTPQERAHIVGVLEQDGV